MFHFLIKKLLNENQSKNFYFIYWIDIFWIDMKLNYANFYRSILFLKKLVLFTLEMISTNIEALSQQFYQKINIFKTFFFFNFPDGYVFTKKNFQLFKSSFSTKKNYISLVLLSIPPNTNTQITCPPFQTRLQKVQRLAILLKARPQKQLMPELRGPWHLIQTLLLRIIIIQ